MHLFTTSTTAAGGVSIKFNSPSPSLVVIIFYSFLSLYGDCRKILKTSLVSLLSPRSVLKFSKYPRAQGNNFLMNDRMLLTPGNNKDVIKTGRSRDPILLFLSLNVYIFKNNNSSQSLFFNIISNHHIFVFHVYFSECSKCSEELLKVFFPH